MSKKRITYIHLFIWLFAIFANIPYTDFSEKIPPQQIVTYLVAFFYLMLVFYLFYLVLAPKFLNRKKMGEFFASSLLVVLIMPFFGYTILFLIRAVFEGTYHDFYRGYSLSMHMSAFFPVLTAAIFGSFFRVIISWFTTMNQKAELDRQKIAVELDLLKSKLNPHFLFNTLNNIDSLIHQDSELASAALIRLSDMMRYLTYETAADLVPLEKEVEYLENFIELNRIRIKSPDIIKFDVHGNLMVMIAPALFVPLLENAFKYATYKNQKPAININLVSDTGIVTLEISNNYEDTRQDTQKPASGFGLVNLRKRLNLTYPERYQMIIDRRENIYYVKLAIDTNAN